MQRRYFFKTGIMGLFMTFAHLSQSLKMNIGRLSKTKNHKSNFRLAGDFDVIVCGAGPAGVAAALSSARKGAKTALIELQGCLGGIWTSGLLSYILDYENKTGIMDEIMQKLNQSDAQISSKIFDPESMKYILERMCIKEGIHLRLHTRVTKVFLTNKNKIEGVFTESKSGTELWNGQVFIDCTGDGDLSALSGAGYDIGHPDSGKSQPMSYIALITGVDTKQLIGRELIMTYPIKTYHETVKKNFMNELKRAGFDSSYTKPTLFEIRRDLVAVMANHLYGYSGLNAQDITDATLKGRKEVHEMIKSLRGLGGLWKNVRICQTPEHIGVREGRRIKGLYTLSREDLIKGARFEDAVCHVLFPVDIHALDDKGEKSYSSGNVRAQSYDIPLRSLISSDIKGLMMAGRCISGDFYAHASYRVTGNAVPMGEFAGSCAATAALTSRMPHEVPYEELN